jgi:L-ascorbate metabolism protein UlaG (beta-lactamase superfamily)
MPDKLVDQSHFWQTKFRHIPHSIERQNMSIEITWLGHSTWWIKTGDFAILIDPFIGDNPACKVDATSLRPTHILISHGHFDHIQDAAEIAKLSNAVVITNFEIASWLSSKHGVSNSVGMNLGGKTRLPFGDVQFTQAVHSSMLPDGSYGGACGGFLIHFASRDSFKSNEYRLYYAGDTALFSDMQTIARGGVDCFIVPIGDLYTMGPEDSIQAIQWVRPKLVLPTHYNTWPPIAQNTEEWVKRVESSTDVRALAPAVGEAVRLLG